MLRSSNVLDHDLLQLTRSPHGPQLLTKAFPQQSHSSFRMPDQGTMVQGASRSSSLALDTPSARALDEDGYSALRRQCPIYSSLELQVQVSRPSFG